jgi:hypothetical protein
VSYVTCTVRPRWVGIVPYGAASSNGLHLKEFVAGMLMKSSFIECH